MTARALSGLWLRLVLKSHSIQSRLVQGADSQSQSMTSLIASVLAQSGGPLRRAVSVAKTEVSGHPGDLGAPEGRHRARGTDSAGQCPIRGKGFLTCSGHWLVNGYCAGS